MVDLHCERTTIDIHSIIAYRILALDFAKFARYKNGCDIKLSKLIDSRQFNLEKSAYNIAKYLID
jgi:hypothetical protein